MPQTTKNTNTLPTLNSLLTELQSVLDAENNNTAAELERPRSFRRKVYKPLRRKATKVVLESLIPMEYRVWQDLVDHPLSSAQDIEKRTGMMGKSVESAIWRLRRIHGIVESIDAPTD